MSTILSFCDAKARQILREERERVERKAAFEVHVTEDNLIAVVCEELLTPTQAIEVIGGRRD